MLPFKLIYSDGYYLPIGEHVFPAHKFRLIHNQLLQEGIAGAEDFLEPEPASDDDVRLAHTSDYVGKLKNGTLSPREELQMEVPYSLALVQSFWLAAGGTISAAEHALRDRVAFQIGGGFHHAFPDHGEGFCMINDIAIAIRRMQKDRKIKRAMTVDCDVHQGNGTAVIFAPQDSQAQPLPAWSRATMSRIGPTSDMESFEGDVFTISLHQENNYPAWKPPSTIDVNLPDGTTDDEYLSWLENALSAGLRQFDPELLCYVAGADPYKEDQLGGLMLTIEGLKQRDLLVFKAAKARGIPVMVTFAGGYAQNVLDTITIHCNTVLAAQGVFAPVASKR
ncbi:MAG: histone deacetylase [Acidobacteriia bacterium]|nr:histone deacetylase [Terriglobia bacterium]